MCVLVCKIMPACYTSKRVGERGTTLLFFSTVPFITRVNPYRKEFALLEFGKAILSTKPNLVANFLFVCISGGKNMAV